MTNEEDAARLREWRSWCKTRVELAHVQWTRRAYRDTAGDHAHCELCWAKLMERGAADVLLEGYASTDGTRWLCPACFDEFKDDLGLVVTGEAH